MKKNYTFFYIIILLIGSWLVFTNVVTKTRFRTKTDTEAKLLLSRLYDLPESSFKNPFIGLFTGFARSGPELQKFTLSLKDIPNILSNSKFSEINKSYYDDYNVEWWTLPESLSNSNITAYRSEGGNLKLWIDHSSGECYVINTGGM